MKVKRGLYTLQALKIVFQFLFWLLCLSISLQMSSLWIHGVSSLCQMNLLYWKCLFEKKESKEWKKRRGEFLPDPAPLCDCCCWAARLDVTWRGCGGTQKQWGKRSRDREDGIKEGGINVGGKRERRDWEKWNKKELSSSISHQKLIGTMGSVKPLRSPEWTQRNSNEIPKKNRGVIQTGSQKRYIKSSELLWLKSFVLTLYWTTYSKRMKDYLTVNILTPEYEFVGI